MSHLNTWKELSCDGAINDNLDVLLSLYQTELCRKTNELKEDKDDNSVGSLLDVSYPSHTLHSRLVHWYKTCLISRDLNKQFPWKKQNLNGLNGEEENMFCYTVHHYEHTLSTVLVFRLLSCPPNAKRNQSNASKQKTLLSLRQTEKYYYISDCM